MDGDVYNGLYVLKLGGSEYNVKRLIDLLNNTIEDIIPVTSVRK